MRRPFGWMAELLGIAALAKLLGRHRRSTSAPAIAEVMIGAWVLAALIEWAASRADRRREEIPLATPPTRVVEAPVETGPNPAWYSPSAEQTMLDASELDATAIGTLPVVGDETGIGALPPVGDDPEATAIGRRPPDPGGATDRTLA
jgi:hypothetical protein